MRQAEQQRGQRHRGCDTAWREQVQQDTAEGDLLANSDKEHQECGKSGRANGLRLDGCEVAEGHCGGWGTQPVEGSAAGATQRRASQVLPRPAAAGASAVPG